MDVLDYLALRQLQVVLMRPVGLALMLIFMGGVAGAQTASDAQLRYVCRDWIEKGLADSDGASLDWTNGAVEHLGDGKYEVVIPGKARNAYNALVWARFWCTVQQTGKDEFRLLKYGVLPQ